MNTPRSFIGVSLSIAVCFSGGLQGCHEDSNFSTQSDTTSIQSKLIVKTKLQVTHLIQNPSDHVVVETKRAYLFHPIAKSGVQVGQSEPPTSDGEGSDAAGASEPSNTRDDSAEDHSAREIQTPPNPTDSRADNSMSDEPQDDTDTDQAYHHREAHEEAQPLEDDHRRGAHRASAANHQNAREHRGNTRPNTHCDTVTARDADERIRSIRSRTDHQSPDTTVNHSIIVVPVSYLRQWTRDDLHPVQTHYDAPVSRNALQGEFFGLETAAGDTIGPAHIKHYLEQVTEGQVTVHGDVAEWAMIPRSTPRGADKCGFDLFYKEPYPEEHPQYNANSPSLGRYISPVIENALLAQGIDNIDDYDTVGVVSICDVDMMRGVAPNQRFEVFGKEVELAFSSHPPNGDIMHYWDFDDAIDLGNVSRNMIHEILHTWGIGHAYAVECGQDSLGSDCQRIGYGNPFSIMGGPIGIFSLDLMDRLRLGVVTDDDFAHVSLEGTYTIGGLNNQDASHRAAYIYWPDTDIVRFTLQFRTGLGYDSAISNNWLGHVDSGLTIHVNSSSWRRYTEPNHGTPNWSLVDPTPANQPDQFDRLSVITDHFHDPYSGIVIEIVSVTSEDIEFTVTHGATIHEVMLDGL